MPRTGHFPKLDGEYDDVSRDPFKGRGMDPRSLVPAPTEAGSTWANQERRLICDPFTGLVRWETKWDFGAVGRRRHLLQPRIDSADPTGGYFDNVGFGDTPILTDAGGAGGLSSGNYGTVGHYVNFATDEVTGSWTGIRSSLLYTQFKWVWDVSVGVWLRTNNDVTGQRVWVACTREPLDGLALPTGNPQAGAPGTVSRTAGFLYDSAVGTTWRAVDWDGFVATSVDTGVEYEASTAYRLKLESESAINTVRWKIYKRGDNTGIGGTGPGVFAPRTQAWGTMPANQIFGLDLLVETLTNDTQAVDFGPILVEHD